MRTMHSPISVDPRHHVLDRLRFHSGETGDLEHRRMSELFPDGWDFIDLCEDLEEIYETNLRPFFEDGQPERGWWIWKRKIARDVLARELVDHIERLVRTKR